MIPDVTEYLSSLKKSAKLGPQVVCHREFPAKNATYAGDLPSLNSALLDCLDQTGISRLYSHQHQAICSILAGNDILVATPTASGKSMIYNLPVLNDLFCDNPGHSLYLFPLKALAQDQRNVLEALFQKLPVVTQKNTSLFQLFLMEIQAVIVGEKLETIRPGFSLPILKWFICHSYLTIKTG
jgi:DEAD/DEAH box helicase domain-containing protein